MLQAADINDGNLSAYDVIVLGIRAYAARPELAASNGRLLDYVKQGGVLIVQYNTREYDHNYGPYPISLTGDPEKVVDENETGGDTGAQEPITFLAQSHHRSRLSRLGRGAWSFLHALLGPALPGPH